MFFSVMTKNLNWENSTKNLVTFKRWDAVNDNIMRVHWKIRSFFGGGADVHEKVFLGGWRGVNRLKSGAWIVCRFKRGLGKRRGHVFEVGRGWDPNAHYELEEPSYWHKYA